MRRLLFLNGIKAFEAAARTGSFAGAGTELNVSAAAVSRMVHLLEQRLGVALFERKANRLAMTAAGRAYQSGLTPIFDALASLTAQVTAPASVRVLTIGVGPTFAMKWLIPRLADFRKARARHRRAHHHRRRGGAVRRRLELRHQARRRRMAGPGRRTPVRRRPVAGLRAAAGGAAQAPGDLKGPSLLRVAHSPDDWPSWLKAAGVARVTARGPEFQYYGQALQAAVDGLGIAMGIRPYIDDDLAAGRLVAPFALSRAERHALVSGLSQLPHRAARLRRVPALDHPRRGGTGRARQTCRPGAAPRRLSRSKALKSKKKVSRSKKNEGDVNEFTSVFGRPWFPLLPIRRSRDMHCDYDGFRIEFFEAGKGLWHARIRRADLKPVNIDGVSFSTLEVGFAWSDPDAAIADAKVQIDQLKLKRYAGQMLQAELQIAAC